MEHSWIKARRKREEKNNTHTHTKGEKRSGDIAEESPDDLWED